jgi:hypothetical protein
MKLTKSKLKQIIKEETQKTLNEVFGGQAPMTSPDGRSIGADDWEAEHSQTQTPRRSPAPMTSQAPMTSPDGRSIGAGDWDAEHSQTQAGNEDILGLEAGGMTTGRRRKAINDAFKKGKIDKDEWRRLRRKYHRSRKKGPTGPTPVNRAALDKMGAKEDPRFKSPSAEELARSKGYLPGSPEWKRSIDISTRK